MRHVTATLLVCLWLAGCAPAPVFKLSSTPLDVEPQAVARAPERYGDARVVWGGRVLEVRNGAAASEIVVLAYPLDGSQRPQPDQSSEGRFVVALPGYVESLDYPPGRYVSVAGRLAGTRVEPVDAHDYRYPEVAADAVHLWPAGFEHDRPQIHFGIGISGAIR